MGEPKSSRASSADSEPPSPQPLPQQPSVVNTLTLVQPSQKKRNKPKVIRVFRSVFRSFPILTPACKFPSLPGGALPDSVRTSSSTCVTGTLFGYRRGRVSLSVQENPRTLPTLVVELSMQTQVLQKEMSMGMVRIALECEKRAEKEKTKLLEEPLWSLFCNGKKSGYGLKREASADDLQVMELLKATSMGAGVLPGRSDMDGPDAELAYIRANFEHVVGSRDSETLYMMSPHGNHGPELSIFFVRI